MLRLFFGHLDEVGLGVLDEARRAQVIAATESRRLAEVPLLLRHRVVGHREQVRREFLVRIVTVAEGVEDALASGEPRQHDRLDGSVVGRAQELAGRRSDGGP